MTSYINTYPYRMDDILAIHYVRGKLYMLAANSVADEMHLYDGENKIKNWHKASLLFWGD